MKKIALAAFSATALLALSACGGEAEEPVVEETTVVEEMTVEPAPTDAAMIEAAPTEAAVIEEAPAE
jgi:hypothetical protein